MGWNTFGYKSHRPHACTSACKNSVRTPRDTSTDFVAVEIAIKKAVAHAHQRNRWEAGRNPYKGCKNCQRLMSPQDAQPLAARRIAEREPSSKQTRGHTPPNRRKLRGRERSGCCRREDEAKEGCRTLVVPQSTK